MGVPGGAGGDAVQPVVSSLGRRTFPYRCSDGSRTFCLLSVDITFEVLEQGFGFGVMSAGIRQTVREQPDT